MLPSIREGGQVRSLGLDQGLFLGTGRFPMIDNEDCIAVLGHVCLRTGKFDHLMCFPQQLPAAGSLISTLSIVKHPRHCCIGGFLQERGAMCRACVRALVLRCDRSAESYSGRVVRPLWRTVRCRFLWRCTRTADEINCGQGVQPRSPCGTCCGGVERLQQSIF